MRAVQITGSGGPEVLDQVPVASRRSARTCSCSAGLRACRATVQVGSAAGTMLRLGSVADVAKARS